MTQNDQQMHRAEVVHIDEHWVCLSAMPKRQCASCALQPGCGQSWRLFSGLGRGASSWLRLRRETVQHLPHLGVGDSVWVTLPKGALLKGSLLLYGVPVFTVLFASALGTAFGFGDLTLAGWVLGLFALSFLVMKWWQHRADKGMALQVLAPVVAPELLPVKGS